MRTSIYEIAEGACALYNTKRNGRPMPIYLEGPPGCGKSAIVETLLPAVLEAGLFGDEDILPPTHDREPRPNVRWSPCGTVAVITEILSTTESTDVRGYSMPLKVDGAYSTHWIQPSIVGMEEWCYNQGARVVIYFFDELAQCDYSTQKAVVDIMLNGRIGSHGLRPTTWCIGAGNRAKDRAGATKLLSILSNRMCTYGVYMPTEAWTKHARKSGIQTLITEFQDYASVVVDEVPVEPGPFPTFRSLFDAGLYVKSFHGDKEEFEPSALLQSSVAGVVGEAASTMLWAYHAERCDLPKPHEILETPATAKVPPSPGGQFAACALVVRLAAPDRIPALWEYTLRLSTEFQAKVANELVASQRGVLLNTPAFTSWMAKHRTLLADSLG